ncbi:MAG: hypothetical protein IPK81_20265 [Rhodospirillales bacterium]|nr:MAG: hypothetical protein IPK81_20265 [Rhodospirillales bacterium]
MNDFQIASIVGLVALLAGMIVLRLRGGQGMSQITGGVLVACAMIAIAALVEYMRE